MGMVGGAKYPVGGQEFSRFMVDGDGNGGWGLGLRAASCKWQET